MAALSDTPPARGLSRLRRNKDKAAVNTSQQSLPSSADDEPQNATGSSSLRASLDNAIDKVKEKTEKTLTRERKNSDASARRRFSSLVPTRILKSKKAGASSSNNASPETHPLAIEHSNNTSESSLNLSLTDGTRSSSLFTVDAADPDGNPIRPSLTPHQSHHGYLTLSSPEIFANTDTVVTEHPDPESRDAAVAVPRPAVPQIIEPPSTEPFPEFSPPERSPSPAKGRSPSPARRLKSAFTLSRNKSSDSLVPAAKFQEPASSKSSAKSSAVETPSSNVVSLLDQKAEVVQPKSGPSSIAPPETPRDRGRSPGVATPLPPHDVGTPTTVVTPPTPTGTSFEFPRASITSNPKSSTPPPRSRGLSAAESLKHRRAQSANLPTKLSSSITAPLTPTIEETKTPGGTLTQPTSATGFFSSFFSAAQKAADQLNTSINGSIGQKGKAVSKEQVEEHGGEEVIVGAQAQHDSAAEGSDARPKAVETLGKGNLNLSHLGISDVSKSANMESVAELSEQTPDTQRELASKRAEEEAAARAVSVAYEKPVEKLVSQATGRPLSISSNDRLPLNGDAPSPPRVDTDALKRTGSVRSKLSGRRKKHRNSSTNTSITAALQTSATGLANLQASGPGHRLTGFAVASSKRNKDFHQLFRSVPEDDYLIEDYSAALQRDILLHGRLYVSEGHICFSSNILGWVTNLVIGFDEVVSVEKKSTAVIFPNAIVIQTLHARNTFASFVARDSTYELLIGIWKINHPNLKSSLNGVTLDNAGTGDKTEVAEPDGSEGDTAEGTEDEVYDEDEDDDVASFSEAGGAPSVAASEPALDTRPPLSRKTSNSPLAAAGPLPNGTASKGSDGAESAMSPPATKSEILGPSAHAPTECGETSEHYDRALIDTTIPAPLGKVYSLMWGPESSAFMRKWLVDEMKSRELNYPDDKFGLDNSHKSVVLDYIKPLNAPIGPKQTKCITTNNLISLDLEKAVSVDCSSSTPDVPNGNAFVTKTRYCLMWGPSNSTRLIATCTIEWSGKSWIKGAIEKGAQEGQSSYVKDLVAALKAAVLAKAGGKTIGKKGKRKGKSDSGNIGDVIGQREAAIANEQKPPHWGLFEPIHPILEPVLDLVRPFITSQVVIAVMFVLLAYTWLVPPRSGTAVGIPGFASQDRLAAYEELWRREESDLWDWLDQRVGVEDIYSSNARKPAEIERQRALQARNMRQKLEKEKMKERQVDDAIRTTEERLRALKEAVEKKRAAKQMA